MYNVCVLNTFVRFPIYSMHLVLRYYRSWKGDVQKYFLQFMVLPLTIENYFTMSHRACNLKITLCSKSQILTDFRKNIQCTVIVCSLYWYRGVPVLLLGKVKVFGSRMGRPSKRLPSGSEHMTTLYVYIML